MVLRRLVALATLALVSAFAQAQYPNKPVKIIVPWPPGGAVDTLARLIQQTVADPLGQPIIIDNKPGAAGAIGSDLVAKAEPDGYTLLMASTSVISINPNVRKLPYQPSDFSPITMVAFVPHILVINADVPATNVKEFVAWAKANKGKVSYGSAGAGTPYHIAGEMFKKMTGVEMEQVPYKGTGPAMLDLLAGRVQIMSVEAVIALPHVKAGRLKALGIATEKRNALAPEIPTVGEMGLPGFEITSWYGVAAPVGVPKDISALLADKISKALDDPAFREKLSSMGATPVGGSPEDFGRTLQRENAKWAKAVKDAGIAIQ
ncbi:MAG TPA: tripartite tricarboxylate transporter substrate binding protein [Usitatibacter sp.]|nr:tripartite tricarboxylate transporter substrate binding protein [Usitatibacter sp.]